MTRQLITQDMLDMRNYLLFPIAILHRMKCIRPTGSMRLLRSAVRTFNSSSS